MRTFMTRTIHGEEGPKINADSIESSKEYLKIINFGNKNTYTIYAEQILIYIQ
jgi:hypothetical protein